MKKILIPVLVLVAAAAYSQTAPTVNLNKLKWRIDHKSDTIQVINFWATWCGPCVKELPIFEKLNAENRPDVNVTLVSMDLDLDPNPDKVYKFVARKKLMADVWLLNEADPNQWIDQVAPEWTGALPATLVVNPLNGKRKFLEGEVTEASLNEMIKNVKN